jgi:hypothetical protein
MRRALAALLLVGVATSGGVSVAAPSLRTPPATPAMVLDESAVPATAATGLAPTLYPLPAAAAQPQPCPLPPAKGQQQPLTRTPKVADAALPEPVAVVSRQVDLDPLTGKGMWWTTWPSSKLDAPGMVARARAAGLRQIWVRTGGTNQGWYGARLLTALLPAAHYAGLAVVAWDYPSLSDPVADATRARAALSGTFGGEHIDAFSPDIETPYEGTYDTARRVALYLSLVRAAADNTPVVATVMNPTPRQLATYPYAAEAPYVDAFAPMVYWSCTEPGAAATAAISALAKLRPVHLIGQAYDMVEDGGRSGMPTGAEIWRFLDVGKSAGAIGVSFYVASSATPAEWAALGGYPWQ